MNAKNLDMLASQLKCDLTTSTGKPELAAIDQIVTALGLPTCRVRVRDTAQQRIAIYVKLLNLISSQTASDADAVDANYAPSTSSRSDTAGADHSASVRARHFLVECYKHRDAVCRSKTAVLTPALAAAIAQPGVRDTSHTRFHHEHVMLAYSVELKRSDILLPPRSPASNSHVKLPASVTNTVRSPRELIIVVVGKQKHWV